MAFIVQRLYGDLWLCVSLDTVKPASDYTRVAFTIQAADLLQWQSRLDSASVVFWKDNTSEGASIFFTSSTLMVTNWSCMPVTCSHRSNQFDSSLMKTSSCLIECMSRLALIRNREMVVVRYAREA